MPTAGGDPHLPNMSGAEPLSVRNAEASREKDVLDRDIFDRQGAGVGVSAGSSGVDGDKDMAGGKAAAGESSSPVAFCLAPGEIWLDGGVLACACPGCGAPMSIRLWLRVADCWRCGTSIELTEEQEQAAWRLLRQQAAQRSPDQPTENLLSKTSSSPAASIPSPKRYPPPLPLVSPKAKPTRPKETALPKEPRKEMTSAGAASPSAAPGMGESRQPGEGRESGLEKSASFAACREASERKGPRVGIPGRRILAAERAFRQRLRQAQQGRPWRLRIQDWLKNLPAWLISLLLHMAALLLLGLWIPENPKQTALILSESVGPYDLESELGHQPEIKVLRPEFDEGGLALEPVSVEEVLGDPTLEGDPLDSGLRRPLTSMQPPNPLIEAPTPALRPGSLFRGRDPAVRNQILYSQGGTSATEAAVARALRWISRHQNPDGSFSLHAFHRTADCQGQCDGAGGESDVAGTALALLPMLGAGQTHRQGEYAPVVRAALAWLLKRQKPNGELYDPGFGRMYAHGLAGIVLCEAYALCGDSQLREAAQRALDFIVSAQHPAGGWRYQPGEAGDTSMVGWQLMALNSGRMAGLKVPTETLLKASQFLNSVQADPTGSKYGYLPGMHASPAMTAEALLCRQYLGWPRNHAGLRGGVRFLLDRHPPEAKDVDIYYWYYAAQVLHHYGGPEWNRWNDRMRRILVDSQVRTGHAAGSWNPDPRWGTLGGRLFQTSLAACTLEVYYRYLPLYRADAVAQGFGANGTSEAADPTSANSSPKSQPLIKGGK